MDQILYTSYILQKPVLNYNKIMTIVIQIYIHAYTKLNNYFDIAATGKLGGTLAWAQWNTEVLLNIYFSVH